MIDWRRADALRAEIGDDGFDEVVHLFLDEADEVMARIAQGVQPTLEADLHFVRGSALNLGFDLLAQLCGAGEQAAGAGEAAGLDLDMILGVYRQSRAAFLRGIAERWTPTAK